MNADEWVLQQTSIMKRTLTFLLPQLDIVSSAGFIATLADDELFTGLTDSVRRYALVHSQTNFSPTSPADRSLYLITL